MIIAVKRGRSRLCPAGFRVKTFGNKFRKERERQRFSIEDVAAATKIGARMLKAIEDEAFDVLPGGIFNKGFIRAYAKHLGMNSEDAVTDYLACLRQREIDAQPASNTEPTAGARSAGKKRPQTSAPQTAKAQPSPVEEELPHLQLPKAEHVRPRRREFPVIRETQVPWKFIAVAAIAITLAAILWTQRARRLPAQTSNSSQTLAVPAAESSSSPTLAQKSQDPETPTPPVAKSSARLISVGSKVGAQPPLSSTSETRASLPAPAPADHNEADHGEEDSAPAATSSRAAAKALTLVIRAAETSWISITADGQPIAHETLIAPAHITVRGNREIIVRTGNAAGITFLLNGQEFPAQGAESEAKTLTFNSAGLASP
jgi:cytoskeleton protein RodZ